MPSGFTSATCSGRRNFALFTRIGSPTPYVWRQWLYPATAVGTLFGLWLARRRIGRGPAAALFYFVGTLFPVLGFMNAYGMRYSFVWDHWVYLPALGIIALAAALVVRGAETLRRPVLVYGFAAIVLPMFAVLTWRQAGMYTNMETLWQTTLAKNPDSSMVHYNLGHLLGDQGHIEEAMEQYQKAIQINPNSSEAQYNLGLALAGQHRYGEAIENFHKAIRINPDYCEALNNLGAAFAALGRFDEAIENYRRATQINPTFAEAQYNLGTTLAAQGQFEEAIQHFRRAVKINPNSPEAQYNLGNILASQGRYQEAIESFSQTIEINPNDFKVLYNLGNALAAQGRYQEAIENYRRAIQINPNFPEALDNLGNALATQGRFEEAIESFGQAIQANPNHPETFLHLGMALDQTGRIREAAAQYRKALKLNPDLVGALNNLAWILATSPEDDLRNGAEAVQLSERACELSHYQEPLLVGTLAAAYAEAGRFPEAVATAEKAEQLAAKTGLTAVAGKNRQLLELYRAGKPYHEPAPATSTIAPSSSAQAPPPQTER